MNCLFRTKYSPGKPFISTCKARLLLYNAWPQAPRHLCEQGRELLLFGGSPCLGILRDLRTLAHTMPSDTLRIPSFDTTQWPQHTDAYKVTLPGAHETAASSCRVSSGAATPSEFGKEITNWYWGVGGKKAVWCFDDIEIMLIRIHITSVSFTLDRTRSTRVDSRLIIGYLPSPASTVLFTNFWVITKAWRRCGKAYKQNGKAWNQNGGMQPGMQSLLVHLMTQGED